MGYLAQKIEVFFCSLVKFRLFMKGYLWFKKEGFLVGFLVKFRLFLKG